MEVMVMMWCVITREKFFYIHIIFFVIYKADPLRDHNFHNRAGKSLGYKGNLRYGISITTTITAGDSITL